MLTSDQVAIVLLAWLFAAGIVVAFVRAASIEPRQARHLADHDEPRGPRTGPILLGQGAGVPDTIRLPRPRPYTAGIPVLAPRPACSLCRDGALVLANTGQCPWCGCERRAS